MTHCWNKQLSLSQPQAANYSNHHQIRQMRAATNWSVCVPGFCFLYVASFLHYKHNLLVWWCGALDHLGSRLLSHSTITNKPIKICKIRCVVILSFNSLISAAKDLLILLILHQKPTLGFIFKNLGTLPGTCDYLYGFRAQMTVTHLILVW